jgi:hypothetical protein
MAAEVLEVIEANERFYRALNALDLGSMERLWSHGSFVRCVHPGWELIVGWERSRELGGDLRGSSGGPTHSVEAADVRPRRLDLGWELHRAHYAPVDPAEFRARPASRSQRTSFSGLQRKTRVWR